MTDVRGWGQVPRVLLDAAETALREGRLGWRCTDQHGRPTNSGDAEPLEIGEWSPVVDAPLVCIRGWHLTAHPHRWRGCRVWLCEGAGECATYGTDKTAWARIRPLAEVDPRRCVSVSAYVRCCANLTGANLTGADLTRANLTRAYLTGAYLTGANLTRANLTRADLTGADLTGAYLTGANLTGADLTRANLTGANLILANLTGAYLTRANLTGADLTGAYLTRANLTGANLTDANLTDADLTRANLTRADLTGANLTDANLTDAYGRDDWTTLVARGAVREEGAHA